VFWCFGTIHRHYSPARRAVGCAMLCVLEPCLVVICFHAFHIVDYANICMHDVKTTKFLSVLDGSKIV
jgi:hypothetical protein